MYETCVRACVQDALNSLVELNSVCFIGTQKWITSEEGPFVFGLSILIGGKLPNRWSILRVNSWSGDVVWWSAELDHF
jgi:hypothetical protein